MAIVYRHTGKGDLRDNHAMHSCCLTWYALQAASLDTYLEDIGIIFALDWFLDRCRSIPNVLGDCFTCAIVQHKSKLAAENTVPYPGDNRLHDALISDSNMQYFLDAPHLDDGRFIGVDAR